MKKEIKGRFDGRNFIGEGGELFVVSENYSSKSKILEGDVMQANVEDSNIHFKVVERQDPLRFIGIYQNGMVGFEEYEYSILGSQKSFFKLDEGDEVIFIVPHTEAKYAVVEAISFKRKKATMKG